jgi:hypothetical protein
MLGKAVISNCEPDIPPRVIRPSGKEDLLERWVWEADLLALCVSVLLLCPLVLGVRSGRGRLGDVEFSLYKWSQDDGASRSSSPALDPAVLRETRFPALLSFLLLLSDRSHWRVYGTLGAGEESDLSEGDLRKVFPCSLCALSKSRSKASSCRKSLYVCARVVDVSGPAEDSEKVEERSEERWWLKCDSRLEGTSSSAVVSAIIAVPCACR